MISLIYKTDEWIRMVGTSKWCSIGLTVLANDLNIQSDPRFIMQDAYNASYNAARKAGLNSEILMCYFHVIYNIKIISASL